MGAEKSNLEKQAIVNQRRIETLEAQLISSREEVNNARSCTPTLRQAVVMETVQLRKDRDRYKEELQKSKSISSRIVDQLKEKTLDCEKLQIEFDKFQDDNKHILKKEMSLLKAHLDKQTKMNIELQKENYGLRWTEEVVRCKPTTVYT